MTVNAEGASVPSALLLPSQSAASSSDSDGAGRRGAHACLAVDDDPGVLAAYELDLADLYTLHLADSAARAFQLLGRHPIDVVLLDLKLPDLPGIEILRRLRRLRPDVPVIVATGHSRHETAIGAANLGVAGYLTKPYDVAELLERIELGLARIEPTRREPLVSEGPPLAANPVDAALQLIRERSGCLTVGELAHTVGVPVRELREACHREWGFAIKTYLVRVRVERARELLRDTEEQIKTIAMMVGFHDSAHFVHAFRRLTGTTPLGYRAANRRA